MRTLLAFAIMLAVTLSLSAPAAARPAAFVSAQATLHTANGSGAMGRINFSQTGTGATTATGTATGLVGPSFGRYVSLVYDLGSVPGGPVNCEPTGDGIADMFVGIWSVDAGGNGTLIFVGPTAPIGTFDSTSSRDTTIKGGGGPGAVVACGEVASRPATR